MADSTDTPSSHAPPASGPPGRRPVLGWIGVTLGGLAAAGCGVPIVGFLLNPLFRRQPDEWVPLGAVEDFPPNETRLVNFNNPHRVPWDGAAGQASAYVRHRGDDEFHIFAVNCAHLGCPVSWFPQSGLFLCPCHGGVYYEDGERAAGPPPRGLFRYAYRVKDGRLEIRAGHLPTLHDPLS